MEKTRKYPKGSPQDIIESYGTTVKISIDEFKDYDFQKMEKYIAASMAHSVEDKIFRSLSTPIRPRDEGGDGPREGDVMDLNIDGASCRLMYKTGEWITESRWDRVTGRYLKPGELSEHMRNLLALHTLSNLGD